MVKLIVTILISFPFVANASSWKAIYGKNVVKLKPQKSSSSNYIKLKGVIKSKKQDCELMIEESQFHKTVRLDISCKGKGKGGSKFAVRSRQAVKDIKKTGTFYISIDGTELILK